MSYRRTLFLTVLLLVPTASAASLPTGLLAPGAAWQSPAAAACEIGCAYVFGGQSPAGPSNQIFRLNPHTGNVTGLPGTFEVGGFGTSAAAIGDSVIVFSGRPGDTTRPTWIGRFDPARETMSYLQSRPAAGRHSGAAAWDGSRAYLFGGEASTGPIDEVLRVDPDADTIETLRFSNFTARSGASAASVGGRIYVFGGLTQAGPLKDILRYDPASQQMTRLEALLPTARSYTSAVVHEGKILVFGGGERDDDVLRFDPATETVERHPSAALGHRYVAAVMDGVGAWVFGGCGSDECPVSRIQHFPFAAPPAPGKGSAKAGPGSGNVTVSWEAVPGEYGVDQYRIYRQDGEARTWVAVQSNGTSMLIGGLQANERPCYRITARNEAGEGPESSRVCVAGAQAIGATTLLFLVLLGAAVVAGAIFVVRRRRRPRA